MIQQSHFWDIAKGNDGIRISVRCLHPQVLCSSIHSIQAMETAHVSVGEQMYEENILHTYSGMLLNHKKERNPAIFDNVDEPEEHMLSEQS